MDIKEFIRIFAKEFGCKGIILGYNWLYALIMDVIQWKGIILLIMLQQTKQTNGGLCLIHISHQLGSLKCSGVEHEHENKYQFPLALMGALAPGSVY